MKLLFKDKNEQEVTDVYDYLTANDINVSEQTFNENSSEYELHIAEDEYETARDVLLDYLNASLEDEKDSAGQVSGKVYVDKKTKYDDLKSTAYTFTFFSITGLVFLALEAANITHILNVASHTRWLFFITLGTLFIIFLVVGIRSFANARIAKQEIAQETSIFSEFNEWMAKELSADRIDRELDNDLDENEKYFIRCNLIRHSIDEKFIGIDDALLEELTEQAYTKLYETED